MKTSQTDIFIIGAGPAGLCAALRLQQMGYRVTIAERSTQWPRPQIGEALTPGVRNIIDLLDANEALGSVPLRARLPVRVRWRTARAEDVTHGDSAIVERGAFDAALRNLARQRGINVLQPARVLTSSGAANAWQLDVEHGDTASRIEARFVIDASGRGHGPSRIDCAPALAATWAEWRCADLPAAVTGTTRVEALENGWLWGTQLPDRSYRVMLLADPVTQRELPGKPKGRLHAACAMSTLFPDLAALPSLTEVRVCSATPYLDTKAWHPGWIKTGDAAFTIDPISSSGVEKAMRFSLQAVTAAHTFLQTSEPARQALAGEFFEERLMETCARHLAWTRDYYARAWCAKERFWQDRSTTLPHVANEGAPADWRARLERLATYATSTAMEAPVVPVVPAPPDLQQLIRFSSGVDTVQALCVVQDQVQQLPALTHPGLARPLAFYEDQALLPRLDILRHQTRCADVLQLLGVSMEKQKAQRLLAWLWRLGVIEGVQA